MKALKVIVILAAQAFAAVAASPKIDKVSIALRSVKIAQEDAIRTFTPAIRAEKLAAMAAELEDQIRGLEKHSRHEGRFLKACQKVAEGQVELCTMYARAKGDKAFAARELLASPELKDADRKRLEGVPERAAREEWAYLQNLCLFEGLLQKLKDMQSPEWKPRDPSVISEYTEETAESDPYGD